MTSISSVNNAALLILQQANASTLANDNGVTSATDKITAIVNGVSSEDSAVKTQASSKINSGLLDVKQANDSLVSDALDFLDSNSFKSSDPSVKDALKQLISDDGDKFAALVKAEKAKNPNITDDNAMANAIQGLIRGNRDKFMEDEFVIGFGLNGGGAIIANIEDVNGNSTSNTLANIHSSNMGEWGSSLDSFLEAGKDQSKLTNSEGGKMNNALNSVMAGLNEQTAWSEKWRTAFGF